MEATIQTKLGLIKVEGENQKELWKEMAAVIEVFDEQKCGLCGCENIIPVLRKNSEEDDFCEYQCRGFVATKDAAGKDVLKDGKQTWTACRAYLYLGQNKKGGGIFPVRALDEKGKPDRVNGKFGRHNGWSRYRGEPKGEGK